MKKIMFIFLFACVALGATAQETVYPAKEHKGTWVITNATLHIGNGQVMANGRIRVNGRLIEEVGTSVAIPEGAQVIDAAGKHVYPGLILASSQLGLVEVPSVRATVDATELGELNPNIRSVVAYNTDSKVINTLRSNGILLAEVYPGGNLMAGSSSVVQLDAWNWEDAVYSMDHAIHFTMPSLLARRTPGRGGFGMMMQQQEDPVKRALGQIESVKGFFREAKSYLQSGPHSTVNLKFEAVRGLFTRQQKLFVHAEIVKEMLIAIDFVKEFGFDVVIVGGTDSWLIAGLLKENNIPVILGQMHNLPTLVDDDVDQPYKTPAMLQRAGVLFAISDEDGSTRSRNLPFNAGTAAAYGLTREEALSAITLNAARILGIADRTGSIEAGKEANIVISEGDILDMKTSIVTHAFIQGRQINLTDKHKQLADRYRYKYGLK